MSSNIVERLLTEQVGWTVAGAIALLVVVGRVKPVRGRPSFTQRAWEKLPGVRTQTPPKLEVERLPVALYRKPPWWSRMLAGVGGGVLSIVLGAMLALVTGAAAVWLVVSLTGRLK